MLQRNALHMHYHLLVISWFQVLLWQNGLTPVVSTVSSKALWGPLGVGHTTTIVTSVAQSISRLSRALANGVGKGVQVSSRVNSVEVSERSWGTSKATGLDDVATAIAVSWLSRPLTVVAESISSLRRPVAV